jgi:hypothetical protein
MIQHLTTTVTGAIPGIAPAGIPLNPRQADYELSNYWRQAPWQAIRSKSKTKDPNSSILSLFMEDEFGKPVSDEVKEEVRGDLYGYWADVLNDVNNTGEVLTRYKDLGFKRKEDFRKTMEGKYPWLRLCEGHWKVRQLWINHFSSWKKIHMLAPPPSTNPADPNSVTPIEVSSDEGDSDDREPMTPIEISSDGDASPTGSKRRREESEDSASLSKKHKGKGKEVAASNFHHPPPQVKKTKAKLAKPVVSNLCLYLLDAY